MIRFIVRALVFFAAAAIGLLVAVVVLDGMTTTWAAFLIDAAIFALLQAILAPFFMKSAARNAPALLGGTGLVTTFVSLLLTSWLGVGLSITGASTWLFATLIVWIVTMLATLLLPIILVRAGVESARERRSSR